MQQLTLGLGLRRSWRCGPRCCTCAMTRWLVVIEQFWIGCAPVVVRGAIEDVAFLLPLPHGDEVVDCDGGHLDNTAIACANNLAFKDTILVKPRGDHVVLA